MGYVFVSKTIVRLMKLPLKVQILSSSVWNDHIFERPGAAGTPWQYVWHSWSKRKHYTWKKPSLEWRRGKMQLYWLVEAESLVWIKVETCSIWSVLVRCAARTASVHVSGGMKDHCSKHLLICSESSLLKGVVDTNYTEEQRFPPSNLFFFPLRVCSSRQ